MPDVENYKPSTFCWVELATSDSDAAKKFYSGLFGWQAQDQQAGPDAVYTMLSLGGRETGALYQMNKEQKSQGVPPHWNSYVSVTSADEIVDQVKTLGGKVIMEPFDVFDAGRMAVLQDPTGAGFCVWQSNKHVGARVVSEPNTSCWNELATQDSGKAGAFYTALFGWDAKEQDMGGMIYTTFMKGEDMAGGMYQLSGEWKDVPSNWLVYFAVEDCDKAAEKAKSLGAKIMSPPTDIPSVGRFCVLQDGQGAAFAVIKLAMPA